MTTRALERVDDWETRSYTGGYRGIHELADQEFSGVVRAGMATLCMLNGNVVGVLDGTIEDFADTDGTAYVAPTPALPLLAVMQERSDEVRAKYYTEDTPLSKVDGTLEDGGFTGFVELSENVLSGDYYVVYHSGRSMSVAFVGERGQLLTEEEAFERAEDEVGIYEVRPVDIDVIDVPEPEPDTSSASGVGAATGDATADGVEADSGPAEDTAPGDTDGVEADSGPVEDTAPGDTDGVEETDTGDDSADDDSIDGTTDRESTGELAQEEDTVDESVSEPDSDTASGDNGTDDSASGDDSAGDSASRTAADDVDTPSRAPADEAETDERGTDRSTTESRQPAGSNRAQSRTDEAGQATETRSTTTQSESTDQPRRSTDRSPAPSGSESRSDGRTDAGGRRTEQSSSNHPGAEAASSDRHSGAATERRQTKSAGDASDLETRTIPSLDPAQSWGTDEGGPQTDTVPVPPVESSTSTSSRQRPSGGRSDRTSSDDRSAGTVEGQSKPTNRTAASESNGRSTPETDETRQEANETGAATGQTEDAGGTTEATDERVRGLEETIEEREARIDDLEARVENAESKRDELEAERDELETERDELREELSSVRSELQSLKEERDALEAQLDGLDVGTDGIERRMSRSEAIEGTNLFVRYGSKSAPTLAAARESGASQSDVKENLSVEYHTQFEVDGTLVEGQPFEEFLDATMEHQFVTWVVTQLLFEIRDTGHREALADLYDALPHVDRVELNGSVGVEFEEDGQTKRAQESFDVVFRDRMGNPLLVANMNDSRQAATENQMNSLVTAATRVGDTNDSLAGAMFVTSSFFEPAALETTADATGGGLLSRDKRESFVKLSRKQGYHLCLVEARDDQFHMAVPEL